jgi:hypothetical protein
MLALATAAHSGQDPTEILIVIAAVAAAIFWRSLLRVALPVILVILAVLLVTGTSAVIHDIRSFLP